MPIAFTAVSLSSEAAGLALRQQVLPNPLALDRLPPVLVDPETAAVRFRYLGEEPGAWQEAWDMAVRRPSRARSRSPCVDRGGAARRRGAGAHRAHPRGHAMTRERGFVLLAVLLVLTLLAVVVTELAFSARLEASMVRSYRDGVLARHLAEAAVQQAIREIATPAQVAALDETGQLVFYRALPGQTTPTPLPALPRDARGAGPGRVLLPARRRERAARAQRRPRRPPRSAAGRRSGWSGAERDIITDSLQDWRDADDLHRLHGAESRLLSGAARPLSRAQRPASRTRRSCSRSAA